MLVYVGHCQIILGRGSRQKVRGQVSKFRMPSYENFGVGVPSRSSRQEVRSWHPKFEVVSLRISNAMLDTMMTPLVPTPAAAPVDGYRSSLPLSKAYGQHRKFDMGVFFNNM